MAELVPLKTGIASRSAVQEILAVPSEEDIWIDDAKQRQERWE
jgi:hypothetical protein